MYLDPWSQKIDTTTLSLSKILFSLSCFKALKQLNENNIFESDSVVVSIFCDHGSRYMSKIYSDEWMEEQGFNINRTKEQFSSIEYIK